MIQPMLSHNDLLAFKTVSHPKLNAKLTAFKPVIKEPPAPSVSPPNVGSPPSVTDRLRIISDELNQVERQCKPENRGYIFAIRTGLARLIESES